MKQSGPARAGERKDAVRSYMDRRRRAAQGQDTTSALPKVSNVYEYLCEVPEEPPEEAEAQVKKAVEHKASNRPKHRAFGGCTRPKRQRAQPEGRQSPDTRQSNGKQGHNSMSRRNGGDGIEASNVHGSSTRSSRAALQSHGNSSATPEQVSRNAAAGMPNFDLRTESWPTLAGQSQEPKVASDAMSTSEDKDCETTRTECHVSPKVPLTTASSSRFGFTGNAVPKGGKKAGFPSERRPLVAVPTALAVTNRGKSTDSDSVSRQWEIYTERLKRSTALGTQASTPAAAPGLNPHASLFEPANNSPSHEAHAMPSDDVGSHHMGVQQSRQPEGKVSSSNGKLRIGHQSNETRAQLVRADEPVVD
ncbi:hypothetical protein LTR85_001660 [Meristemomyces frigidus]|nr:hypothetical protein LTR85_001660 [Meristemomyces frigidus]